MLSLFITTLLLVSCFVIPVSANELPETTMTNIIDLKSLDAENPNVKISEPMTFTEMVSSYAEIEGISYEEALAVFPKESSASARTPSHRMLSVTLNVTGSYKPTLNFYCNTSEGGNFWGITSIYSVQLNRTYGNTSKQFSGTIDVWLRSGYQIEYIVNGDFYNNGTTSASGGIGLNIGVGSGAQVSFQISSSSNHYKYFYEGKLVSFQR